MIIESWSRFILIMVAYYFICNSDLIKVDYYFRPNSSKITKYKKEIKKQIKPLIKGTFKVNYGKHSYKQRVNYIKSRNK